MTLIFPILFQYTVCWCYREGVFDGGLSHTPLQFAKPPQNYCSPSQRDAEKQRNILQTRSAHSLCKQTKFLHTLGGWFSTWESNGFKKKREATSTNACCRILSKSTFYGYFYCYFLKKNKEFIMEVRWGHQTSPKDSLIAFGGVEGRLCLLGVNQRRIVADTVMCKCTQRTSANFFSPKPNQTISSFIGLNHNNCLIENERLEKI